VRATARHSDLPAAGPALAGATRLRLAQLRGALVAALALAALVLAGNLAAYRLRAPSFALDVGGRADRAAVAGMHGPEVDSAGDSYRWTDGNAALALYGPAANGTTSISFDLGWLPPGAASPRAVELQLDGQPWASIDAPNQPRRYALLLPPGALLDGVVHLGLKSEAAAIPPDDRTVGVRLDGATLSWSGAPWPLPAPIVLGAQLGLGLIWLALARLLGVAWPWALGVALAMAGVLVAHAALAPHLAALWQGRLLGAGAASGAVVWGASRIVPRAAPGVSRKFVNALLLITLVALMARLLGALYPLFFSHDLLVNSGRLRNVQLGILTLFDRPSEFSRNVAVVSPTAFIFAAPLTLIGDRTFALQFLCALLDGLTPLLVALLALRLGLSERVALVAAGLIALLPMHLTALYWGFVKQIVGQWLTLLFFVVLAGPAPRRALGWLAAGALCAVNFLIHPGGLLLSGISFGLFVLLGLWPLRFGMAEERRRTKDERRRTKDEGRLSTTSAGSSVETSQLPNAVRQTAVTGDPSPFVVASSSRISRSPALGWLLVLLGASAVALAVQYAEAARLMVGGLLDGSTATLDSTNQVSDSGARLWQIWVGINASFEPLPLPLAVAGVAALLWLVRGHGRSLLSGWLASALLFLLVDIVTGQQVRYGYYTAPIICIGVAALVERLLSYRLGRLAVWGLVALVAIAGLLLWGDAIFLGAKPTVNPLTH
jgi:hypothetical protein